MKNIIILFLFIILTFTSNNVSAENSNEIVYVEDFGAYGDGIHDDSIPINNALNSGAKVVIFKKDSNYKLTDCIIMKTSDVEVIGNNATLFTDNDYRNNKDYYEWFFNIVANNIIIKDINIEARETILVGYKTQFTIRYSSNVTIDNCKFIIPKTVLSDESTRNVEYSNMDIFTGWHSIFISNCTLIQMADTEAGVNISFRDVWNSGCDTAIFTNNICISNSHDEMLAMFSFDKNNISNIKIYKNTFKAIKGNISKTRNVGISLGYCIGEGGGINGVEFIENKLNISSDYVLFLIGNSTNVNISRNTIEYNVIPSENTAYLVRGVLNDNSVEITNNKINIVSDFGGLIDGRIYFKHNTIKSNSAVTDSLFKNESIAYFNEVEINNKINRIGYCIYNFEQNKIISRGSISTMFEFFNKYLIENINISENIVIIDDYKSEIDTFLMLNGTNLNNFNLNVNNNKINILNKKNIRNILYISNSVKNKHNIMFKNNKVGKYILEI